MKKFITSVVSLVSLAPALAFAQIGTAPVTNADQLAVKLQAIGNVVIELLITLAVIWIIVSVIRYLISGGEDKTKFLWNAIWGIVGLAIILSIWGLVYLLRNTFNTGTNAVNSQDVPQALPLNGQNVYGH